MKVLVAHVIISAYGFWLPNDPPGSWSDFVAAWELFRYGRATCTPWRVTHAVTDHFRAHGPRGCGRSIVLIPIMCAMRSRMSKTIQCAKDCDRSNGGSSLRIHPLSVRSTPLSG